MKIDELPEYSHDLKQLLKKFPSLTEDVARACKVIEAYPNGIAGVIVRVDRTGLATPIFKVRHFRCKSMGKGSRSGIRLIYARPRGEDRVVLCELYRHSPGKTDLDLDRLKRHFC